MQKLKIPFKIGPAEKPLGFNALSVLAYTKEDFAKRAEQCGWTKVVPADKIYAAAEKAKAAYEAKNSTKVAVEPNAKPEPGEAKKPTKEEKPGK